MTVCYHIFWNLRMTVNLGCILDFKIGNSMIDTEILIGVSAICSLLYSKCHTKFSKNLKGVHAKILEFGLPSTIKIELPMTLQPPVHFSTLQLHMLLKTNGKWKCRFLYQKLHSQFQWNRNSIWGCSNTFTSVLCSFSWNSGNGCKLKSHSQFQKCECHFCSNRNFIWCWYRAFTTERYSFIWNLI